VDYTRASSASLLATFIVHELRLWYSNDRGWIVRKPYLGITSCLLVIRPESGRTPGLSWVLSPTYANN